LGKKGAMARRGGENPSNPGTNCNKTKASGSQQEEPRKLLGGGSALESVQEKESKRRRGITGWNEN